MAICLPVPLIPASYSSQLNSFYNAPHGRGGLILAQPYHACSPQSEFVGRVDRCMICWSVSELSLVRLPAECPSSILTLSILKALLPPDSRIIVHTYASLLLHILLSCRLQNLYRNSFMHWTPSVITENTKMERGTKFKRNIGIAT
jgi:hypothetical protein